MIPHPKLMDRRRAAAEACRARFAGQPYDPGKRDCVRLAAHNLHKLGVKVAYLKGLTWTTDGGGEDVAPRGGLRQLQRLGFKDLHEAVDALGLPRIAMSRALLADIVALPTSNPIGALGVYMGNGAVLGYHEDSPNGEVIQVTEALHAWRVVGG